MSATHKVWSIDDIEFNKIEIELVKDNEVLFFVLASASLIESGSDLYTSTLIDFFGESEAAQWLRDHWEYEELQHGRSLRRYVETVWPEFDWELAFSRFIREYSLLCTLDQLENSPTLELIARCVVETGTAALYRALHDYTDEPILKQLTGLIRADEVRHYKYFHRFFTLYNNCAGYGRWPVLRTLQRRLIEVRNEDADCALRHVFGVRYAAESSDSAHFIAISKAARNLVIENISTDMMVKMFLQPLRLPVSVRSFVQKPCALIMQHFLAH
jgi:hypothetical protein